jgi:hypothetical protein
LLLADSGEQTGPSLTHLSYGVWFKGGYEKIFIALQLLC